MPDAHARDPGDCASEGGGELHGEVREEIRKVSRSPPAVHRPVRRASDSADVVPGRGRAPFRGDSLPRDRNGGHQPAPGRRGIRLPRPALHRATRSTESPVDWLRAEGNPGDRRPESRAANPHLGAACVGRHPARPDLQIAVETHAGDFPPCGFAGGVDGRGRSQFRPTRQRVGQSGGQLRRPPRPEQDHRGNRAERTHPPTTGKPRPPSQDHG